MKSSRHKRGGKLWSKLIQELQVVSAYLTWSKVIKSYPLSTEQYTSTWHIGIASMEYWFGNWSKWVWSIFSSWNPNYMWRNMNHKERHDCMKEFCSYSQRPYMTARSNARLGVLVPFFLLCFALWESKEAESSKENKFSLVTLERNQISIN